MTARALLVGDRIDTAGLERPDTLSQAPLAFRTGAGGMVALFRFGVAVMVGLSPLEEEDLLGQLRSRIAGARARGDDETATLADRADGDEPVEAGRPDPHQEPVARAISGRSPTRWRNRWRWRATSARSTGCSTSSSRSRCSSPSSGRPPFNRRAMLQLIGQALLAQHRVSGRVAVEEKPDVLWDRPDLERLYARLEDEYELKERAGTLKRKLEVIVETAHALTDIMDANRATRLEATVAILIVAELLVSLVQIVIAWRGTLMRFTRLTKNFYARLKFVVPNFFAIVIRMAATGEAWLSSVGVRPQRCGRHHEPSNLACFLLRSLRSERGALPQRSDRGGEARKPPRAWRARISASASG